VFYLPIIIFAMFNHILRAPPPRPALGEIKARAMLMLRISSRCVGICLMTRACNQRSSRRGTLFRCISFRLC
jgi:hypothetical protein